MNKIYYGIAGMLCVFPLLTPHPVLAAKKRVAKTTSVQRTVSSGGGGVSYSKARLNRATNSVALTFMNVDKVKRIDYMLSYKANGMSQGAGGAVVANGQATDSRDLYFGTCSHGVCTPHRNITGATLVVTTTLTTGGTNVKRYRIKV